MEKQRKYNPISCSFVDIIEHVATLRKKVELVYLVEGVRTALTTTIKTWVHKDKVEHIVLTEGTAIRFDDIVSIDEHILSEYGDHCEVKR